MKQLVVCVVLFCAAGAIGLRLSNPQLFDDYASSVCRLAGEMGISQPRPLPSLESLPVSKTLTPAQAYVAIPHRRTQFDFRNANLSADDAEYLQRIFPLLDQCVVWRVVGQRRLQSGTTKEPTLAEADALLRFAESIDPPRSFRRYHALVVEALTAQRDFFAAARGRMSHNAAKTDPQVQRASRALHAAYSEMLKQVGESSQRNAKAVFDYHCAFDFI
jgi:hypothetical protein